MVKWLGLEYLAAFIRYKSDCSVPSPQRRHHLQHRKLAPEYHQTTTPRAQADTSKMTSHSAQDLGYTTPHQARSLRACMVCSIVQLQSVRRLLPIANHETDML
jgi:hypothetical protein